MYVGFKGILWYVYIYMYTHNPQDSPCDDVHSSAIIQMFFSLEEGHILPPIMHSIRYYHRFLKMNISQSSPRLFQNKVTV